MNKDFNDLFVALSAVGARFLVVGGYAVSFHWQPRYTKDLNVWVEPTSENASRVHAALRAFGTPLANLAVDELTQPGLIYQIGLPPNRIDILTSIMDVSFEEAWRNHSEMNYGEQRVPLIGRRELIRNKRAVGRPQDLVDAAELERQA